MAHTRRDERRCATAVGEGSMAAGLVDSRLAAASLDGRERTPPPQVVQ
jgi:hypothetical protein